MTEQIQVEQTNGVDFSGWQDDNSTPQHVDCTKARAMGARFGFVKVSQACWMDLDYLFNWAAALAAYIARGGYHFLTWDQTPVDQAKFFAGVLKADPGEISPVIDYECMTNVPYRAKAISRAKAFCQEVESILGRKMIIYTSPGYWKEFGDPDDAYWADRKLWIANYYVQKPTVPAPWKNWTFWQYDLGKGLGKSYGMESLDIDRDKYNGTAEQLAAEFGFTWQVGGTVTKPVEEIIQPANNIQLAKITTRLRVRTAPVTSLNNIVTELPAGITVGVYDQPEVGSDTWAKLGENLYCAKNVGGQEYMELI